MIEPIQTRRGFMDEPGDRVDGRFERFYRDNFTQTARLVRLLTNRPDVADDLAQDSFVRVYRYAQNADRPIDNPAALLRTTTVNVCRSWHTSQQRLQQRMVRHGADSVSLTDSERELDASLRRLPYDQRAVVVLRYWLGLTEGEIAEALECRPGTVKSRLSRALKALRKELT
jgi:RNA polymerase sigma factor (sigma-70 family)